MVVQIDGRSAAARLLVPQWDPSNRPHGSSAIPLRQWFKSLSFRALFRAAICCFLVVSFCVACSWRQLLPDCSNQLIGYLGVLRRQSAMWYMLDMSSTLNVLLLLMLSAHASAELPFCKRYQACAAELSNYPLLSETVGEMVELEDGSGEASGQSFPIYDEFVETVTPFDFGAQPSVKAKHLCRCVDSLGTSQGRQSV